MNEYSVSKASIKHKLFCDEDILDYLLSSNKISKKQLQELKFPIYMDYQATTKVDPRILEKMKLYFSEFSNPHSRSHVFGWVAEDAVEDARYNVARLINAQKKEIIFCSGATEASNLAIKGIAKFYGKTKKHIITSSIEHKCVIDPCRSLESEGFRITYLPVGSNGMINIQDLIDAIDDDTILVSIIMANNEIGVIQPVEEIGRICKEKNVFFHTDAAQAFGKIKVDVVKMNIDLLSISGHKIYAPMGIGALYVRKKPRVRISPIIHGGGQERGMRSGTISTPLVVGLGEASRIAYDEMEEEGKRERNLLNIMYNAIMEALPDTILNGDKECRLPNNLNLSFPYVEGESIMAAIKEVAVSSGSACTSASLEPSYVLRALGIDEDLAHSSIRFSIGRFTKAAEIFYVVELIKKKIKKLRDMSPLWEMANDGIDLKSIKWSEH